MNRNHHRHMTFRKLKYAIHDLLIIISGTKNNNLPQSAAVYKVKQNHSYEYQFFV